MTTDRSPSASGWSRRSLLTGAVAGAVVGGVGVSAGTVDEDHQVAEAGRKAYVG